MIVGDRVRHISGVTGRVVEISTWVYVLRDGTKTTVPYYATSLEVIDNNLRGD